MERIIYDVLIALTFVVLVIAVTHVYSKPKEPITTFPSNPDTGDIFMDTQSGLQFIHTDWGWEEYNNDFIAKRFTEIFDSATDRAWTPALKLFKPEYHYVGNDAELISSKVDYHGKNVTIHLDEDCATLTVGGDEYTIHGMPGTSFLVASLKSRDLFVVFDISTGVPSLQDNNFINVTERELEAVTINDLYRQLIKLKGKSRIIFSTTTDNDEWSFEVEEGPMIDTIFGSVTVDGLRQLGIIVSEDRTVPVADIVYLTIRDEAGEDVLKIMGGYDQVNSPFVSFKIHGL